MKASPTFWLLATVLAAVLGTAAAMLTMWTFPGPARPPDHGTPLDFHRT